MLIKYVTDHAGPRRCETRELSFGTRPFCFILFPRLLINLIFFGLKKTGAKKTAHRVPKLGYFDGRGPKVSSRVTLAPSGAGVVCHVKVDTTMLNVLWCSFPAPEILFRPDVFDWFLKYFLKSNIY